MRALSPLSVRCLLTSAFALAACCLQPPRARADAGLLVLSALRLSYPQALRAPVKRDHLGGPIAPSLPSGMRALMEQRFGSVRAKKMTEGFSTPSGMVLRPMFWIPRAPGGGMRGAMFALGGRF